MKLIGIKFGLHDLGRLVSVAVEVEHEGQRYRTAELWAPEYAGEIASRLTAYASEAGALWRRARGRPRKRLDAAAIGQLRDSGASWREIGARFGCSAETARKALRNSQTDSFKAGGR